MTYLIIVARYNENIIIYNKGAKLDRYNEILLNNVGREGHTYIFDNLEDYTIFLQGNPFDHSPNIISTLNEYVNKELSTDFDLLKNNINPIEGFVI